MIGGGVFGCNQDKKQMRRSPIQRCEINPFGAARKHPENSVHTTEFSVRDRYAFADRGGTDTFPVEQHLEDLALIEMMRRPQVSRHLLEGSVFVAACQWPDQSPHKGHDVVLCQETSCRGYAARLPPPGALFRLP